MANMRIRNFTPHTVNLVEQDGRELLSFESEGIARCSVDTEAFGYVIAENGLTIDLTRSVMGNVEGLPKEQEDTLLIVSRVVAEAVKGVRSDCVIPNESVRNDKGQIVGCMSFGVL